MTQPIVFVSYSHYDEEEKDRLLSHLQVLQQSGSLEVWSDDQIRAGSDWKQAYLEALARAKIAILLISANFLASEFILTQELPALLKRRNQGDLIILPIIAKACAWMNVAWLTNLEVRPRNRQPVWSSSGSRIDKELVDIAKEIGETLKNNPSLTSSNPVEPLTIESPYGAVSPEAKFYIEREADHDCWKYLRPRGSATTIFIQAPRQMGKSSLMWRMTHRVKEYGVATVFIDFQKFSEQQLANEEEFLIELCLMISDALHIPEAIDQYWTSHRSNSLIKCSNYLSQYIIPKLNTQFILAMDEVDRLLKSPVRSNFFGMLRSWHNERAFNTSFAKMILLLSSSTEAYLLVDNLHQSPFNVGARISLRDFTLAEVEELNQRHQFLLNRTQVNDLMSLLDGHPFLTRLAFYLLATKQIEFDSLMANATSDDGPFSAHLRQYWQNISDTPELKQALAQISRLRRYPDDRLYYQLRGAGLVKKEDSRVVMRNNLYRHYFMERLNG
jgi:AAA-like domain/TIR domain